MPRKPRASPNPPGQPAFAPSKEQRQLVTVLRGAGTDREVIARLLAVSLPTLEKHFRQELTHGKAEVLARVASKCITKAMNGDNAMIAYYLSRHGGPAWADKQKHEHTGAGGKPLPAAASITVQVTDPLEAARIYQRMIDGE